jgi:hypothetical protein
VQRRYEEGGFRQVIRVGVLARVAGDQGADRAAGPRRAQGAQQRGQVGNVVEFGARRQAGTERLGRLDSPCRAQRDEQTGRVPPGAQVSLPGRVAGQQDPYRLPGPGGARRVEQPGGVPGIGEPGPFRGPGRGPSGVLVAGLVQQADQPCGRVGAAPARRRGPQGRGVPV